MRFMPGARTAAASTNAGSIRAHLIKLGLLTGALSLPIWGMRPDDFNKFGEIKYEFVMIIAALAATCALMEALAHGGFQFRPSAWLWGIGGLVLVSLAASLSATDPVTAVNGSFMRRDGFLMLLGNSMLFLTAYGLAQRRSGLWAVESLAKCLVAAAVPVLLYGVAQSLGLDPFAWEPGRGEGGRAFSTLGNPIFLGAYAATVTLVAFGLWLSSGGRRRDAVWVVVMALGGAVTVLTAARASWIGLAAGAVAVLLMAFARRESRGRAAAGLAGGIMLAAVLVTGVLAYAPDDRVETVRGTAATLGQIEDARNSGRKAIWAISVRMIADRPLLGVGLDSMGGHFEEYRTPEYDRAEGADRNADKPHSSVLEWAVETGLPGAALATGLVVAILAVSGWTLLARSSARGRDWIVAGVWAGAAAYALQSTITVTAIGVDGVWWILLGLLAGWLLAEGDAHDPRPV